MIIHYNANIKITNNTRLDKVRLLLLIETVIILYFIRNILTGIFLRGIFCHGIFLRGYFDLGIFGRGYFDRDILSRNPSEEDENNQLLKPNGKTDKA